MNMIEVKTAELSGAALDWAVAMTGAVTVEQNGLGLDERGRPTVGCGMQIPYEPSKNWAQCGPLIDRYIGNLYRDWTASETPTASFNGTTHAAAGDTFLIAACRAICIAYHGHTVQIPAELLP